MAGKSGSGGRQRDLREKRAAKQNASSSIQEVASSNIKCCSQLNVSLLRKQISRYFYPNPRPRPSRLLGYSASSQAAPPKPSFAVFSFQGINRNGITGKVIDGKSIAAELISEIANEVSRMKNAIARVPGLAVIIVGQRKDSQTYVRNKIKACEEAGIVSLMEELPEHCAEDEVMTTVSNFNDDPSVHGILVQLPLPQHMDEEKILSVVSLEKDVDGFHPTNMGNLAMRGRVPLFIPCTPKACIELLLRSGVEIMGKKAVVIGRSNIVGTPISLLLQRHHATVSTIHAYTRNPEVMTREADIVVSAVGVANLVRGDWLKPGAVVIDVGTNPVETLVLMKTTVNGPLVIIIGISILMWTVALAIEILSLDCQDPSSENGYYLTGDVCYEEALPIVSAITPVPGGVGPMTIAMLLSNTLDSAKRAFGFS
ncbi:Bifunctional protein FolD 1, mitochondrial [Asimina triloba]